MELIPKHGLRSPSVTERTCNIYKLIMMSRQKAHKGNKFLDLNLKKNYKNETTFTLDKYVKKLKDIFNVLDKYGAPIYKDHMVEHLLDQTMSPNTELNTEVNICRLSHTSTFAKAYMYLYTLVVRIYPYTNHSSGKFINHCIYAAGHVDWSSGRCGCFNGLGHGPGGEVRVGRGRDGR